MTTEAFIASVIAGVVACIAYELVSYIYLTIKSNKYVKKLNTKCKIFLSELNMFLDYNEKDKKYPKCTIKEFKEKVISCNSDSLVVYNHLKILGDLQTLNTIILKSLDYPYLTKQRFLCFQDLYEKFYNIEISLMFFLGNCQYRLSNGAVIPVSIDDAKIDIVTTISKHLIDLNNILF